MTDTDVSAAEANARQVRARSVACPPRDATPPGCGAPAREPCRTLRGVITATHQVRWAAYYREHPGS